MRRRSQIYGWPTGRTRLRSPRFLYWLKKQRERGFAGVTELSAGEKLEAFRREQEHYLEPSFETICACGATARSFDYTASEETNTALRPEGFLLVDSGGQYMEGDHGHYQDDCARGLSLLSRKSILRRS